MRSKAGWFALAMVLCCALWVWLAVSYLQRVVIPRQIRTGEIKGNPASSEPPKAVPQD